MQTYTHYKESGIDWIGPIPEHWECKRLGNWFEERRRKVSDKDFEPLSVTKNGIVPQLDSAAKSNDGDNRKLVITGDFVINSRSDRKGSSGLSYLDGSVSLINIVMKPRGIFPRFSEFLLKSNGFIEEFYRNGHGIVADLWTTRYDEMKFIFLAIPPIYEQKAIANFLDEKTAKIDALVQTKEQQIEKLKELRQAKIHQAVTKGLDANAPTKDSGVEWIGEIPKYWEVLRVKQVTLKISKGTTPSTEGGVILDVGPIRYIKAENIQDDIIVDSPKFFIDYKTNELLKRSELKVNDLLFVIAGATLGKIAILGPSHVPSNTNQAISFLRPSKKIIPLYLKYWLKGKLIFDRLWQLAVQSAQPNLSMENLGNMPLFLPPIQEQEQIVTYLDEVTSKIDQAIAQKQEQITKLKEYKQSLINDVVTGKVKVC